jgi:hypothetical protein
MCPACRPACGRAEDHRGERDGFGADAVVVDLVGGGGAPVEEVVAPSPQGMSRGTTLTTKSRTRNAIANSSIAATLGWSVDATQPYATPKTESTRLQLLRRFTQWPEAF